MLDLAGALGPIAATIGTFGLVVIGRAFLRAQAIADALRIVGFLTIALGIMATLGLVEINGSMFVEYARQAVEAFQWAAESGGGW